jgi:hypothetical protein
MASVKEVLRLLESIDDERYVVVYSDYDGFRKIYSQHTKKRIGGNEAIILLPYYENVDRTRTVLKEAGINVGELKARGYLVIMDSYAAYLGFQKDSELLFSRLVSHAVVSRKSCICVIADMGAFFLIDRVARTASGRIKVKGFCTYHQKDFEKLSEAQKKAIFGKGYKALVLQ